MEKFKFNDGIYEGEAIDGVPNGKGKFTSTVSYVYEGEFLNGNFHGKGKLISSDGSVLDGMWINDEFIDNETYQRMRVNIENGITQTLSDAEIIEIHNYYTQASIHMSKNNFVEEFEALSKALAIAPNNASTLVKIGRCYRSLGQHDNAIDSYKKAIQIDPSFGVAYTNLGLVYLLKEEWLEAIKQYKTGLALSDQNTDEYWTAYANYAIVIGNLGDTDRAKEMISEAEKHGYKNGDNCRYMAGIK